MDSVGGSGFGFADDFDRRVDTGLLRGHDLFVQVISAVFREIVVGPRIIHLVERKAQLNLTVLFGLTGGPPDAP